MSCCAETVGMEQMQVARLKADVVNTIRRLMEKRGSVESYYNKITGGTGACENVPTAFILRNTKNLSFLSQTDQLLMEAEVLEYDLPGVWTLGRSYRNEPKAGDGRHLSEFALLEFEGCDMDLNDLLQFQQEILDLVMKVGLDCPAVPCEHKKRLEKYLKTPAIVVTYSEVLKRLNDGGVSINWGADFSSSIEEMLCLVFDGPVQVTHYPESIKFFNMYRTDREPLPEGLSIEKYNNKNWTVDCVDLLLPFGGESIGGSRREESYETLQIKLRESSMFKQMANIRANIEGFSTNEPLPEKVLEDAWKPFASYLELFNTKKHPDRGSFKRSGFGLGMGRLIQFLLGEHIIVPF